MATASISSGRRRHRSDGLRPSRKKAMSSTVEKTKDEAKEDKPDVEQLRSARAAYYSRSPEERRRASSSIKTSHSLKSSSVVTAKRRVKAVDEHGHRRKRKHSTSKDAGGGTPTRTRANSEDYVYAAQPKSGSSVAAAKDIAVPDLSEVASTQRSERRSSSRRHSRSSRSSETRDGSSQTDEVIPRLERRVSVQGDMPSLVRPSLKRSSTTSATNATRLSTLSEEPDVSDRKSLAPSAASSRLDSRRKSSLLSAIFQKKAPPSAAPLAPRLVDCLTCGSDDVPVTHSAKLSCGHRMCHECLKRIFTMSVTDPQHMPPKCCTDEHIPLKHVDNLFSLKFKVLWNRKYQEYNTKNRIYCPAKGCGEWIKPSHFGNEHGRKYGRCTKCKSKVCCLCNGKWHSSQDCPNDEEAKRFVEIAKEKGWQRCSNCKAMVELKEGCNHMTCRCRHEFCILCGAEWKTCECPWFNYGALPDPDRLNDMRVPEPIQVIYRRVFAHAQAGPPPAPLPAEAPGPDIRPQARRARTSAPTYQQEIDNRQRQERLDADLARRMQIASIMGNDAPAVPPRPGTQVFGLGNAAGHFMNEDFVQNAANIVMDVFGDVGIGRRGERSSARRRRARDSNPIGTDAGLAPNAFGTESVLGIAPSPRLPPRAT